MNPLLMEDTFIQIAYQIEWIKILVQLEETSKWHRTVIRKNRWIEIPMRFTNDDSIIYMLKTHNFGNICLSSWEKTKEPYMGKLYDFIPSLVNGYTYITDTVRLIKT